MTLGFALGDNGNGPSHELLDHLIDAIPRKLLKHLKDPIRR
jgi:hypothetical protein